MVASGQPCLADYPVLTGWLVDTAKLVPMSDVAAIDARLAGLERRTKHQMVVVTVPTLGGQDPRDYGRCLGNRWDVGRAGVDDGAILVLARKERKVRLAVGDGLRASLTDGEAKSIIDRDVVPAMKHGRVGAGIKAAIDSVGREIGDAP